MKEMSLLKNLMYFRNFYKGRSKWARKKYEKIKAEGQTRSTVMSDEEVLVLWDTRAADYRCFGNMLNKIVNDHLKKTSLEESVWVKVLKPFGYYIEDHPIGELMKVDLIHVNDLVKDGYVKIVVNNMGENNPVDVDLDHLDPFEAEIIQPSEE
ncbi:hypothetical protein [Bacillus phage SBSphiJ6]|nr:hypothetical protein [Bacillus phage SBSphiJ1]UPI12387.1 hypothetical protein [Bacillus phage SBSphiJ3]UPI13129.1 hypothetical protein [Bacillus phage SBSphiJ6]